MQEWISVKDRLPEIPQGLYGVSVIVAQFDPVYEECCPGHGFRVGEGTYMLTKDRHGEILPLYQGTGIEADFTGLHYCMKDKTTSWGPTANIVTHWMPLPTYPGPGWIDVRDRLPLIPGRRHAVQVLGVQFDPCFEELNPGRGHTVGGCTYGPTRYKNGAKLKMYENSDLEHDFMELWMGGGEHPQLGPVSDEVTHWRWFPDPPVFNLNEMRGLVYR